MNDRIPDEPALCSAKPRTRTQPALLSVVIPCFNESATLQACVEQVLLIADETLNLEIIIVDDGSTDDSVAVASKLENSHDGVRVLRHEENQGKGAALRTGIEHATGDYVAIHDADLEYDPQDLKRLLVPLQQGKADVVIGSRFLTSGAHRVLYFWHSVANRILTLFSNMLTDLNLSDIECCHKVFLKDVIKDIDLAENRFGVEPEIIAKIARRRLRIYEMGVTYSGRSYAEGKKIGWKDAIAAIYCILHYNLPYCAAPIQFLFYLFVGGTAALVNLSIFVVLFSIGVHVELSAPIAFLVAAGVNYLLSIAFVFRHNAKWRTTSELVIYIVVVLCIGAFDLWITKMLLLAGFSPVIAKGAASISGLLLNYLGRRYVVFFTKPTGDWR